MPRHFWIASLRGFVGNPSRTGSQKGTPLLRPSRLLANCPLSEPEAEDYESFVPQRHDRIDMRRISRRYIACRERNDRKKSRGAAEGQGIARSHAI